MLQIEEIRSLDRLASLREEWRALQQTAGARSFFLSPDWFLLCARHLAPNQRMLILCLRRDGRLVGVAPMMSERARLRRLPVTRIRFLENHLTPFADSILAEPEEGMAAILGYFRETRRDWDVLSLSRLREDSPHLKLLDDLLRRNRRTFRTSVVSRTPFLRIERTWEEFYQSKSQKFRKTRRSITNKVERLGPLTVELVSRPEDTQRGLEQWLELSRRSRIRKHGTDLLTPEFERAFFIGLSELAGQAGAMRLWLLKKENELLAAEYHIDDRGVEYGLRSCYDETYSSSSPGAYLDLYIVRHLFENGASIYDMGPGLVEYKRAWTDSLYQCYGVDVFNRSFYAGLLGRLETRWIPAIKSSALRRWIEHRPPASANPQPPGDS